MEKISMCLLIIKTYVIDPVAKKLIADGIVTNLPWKKEKPSQPPTAITTFPQHRQKTEQRFSEFKLKIRLPWIDIEHIVQKYKDKDI